MNGERWVEKATDREDVMVDLGRGEILAVSVRHDRIEIDHMVAGQIDSFDVHTIHYNKLLRG